MQKLLPTFTIVLLLALALSAPSVSAQQPIGAPIRLQAATFNPLRGEKAQVDPALTIPGYAPGERGYFIVQFRGPVREAWKNQVTDLGAELLDYIPDFAFKARMTMEQAERVRALAVVAWVGIFEPAFKLSPFLSRAPQAAYTVQIEAGADVAAAIAAINATGAQVETGRRPVPTDAEDNILRVSANPAQVEAIARVLDVAWVENYVRPIKHNEYGGGVIIGANVANSNGYDGSTQIAAVADTGIGDGTPAGAHPDIPASRIVGIFNWPGSPNICFAKIKDDGAVDVDSGHGTHTAGSVLSDGGASGEGRGVAPAARLVFQALENFAKLTPLCQEPGLTEGYFLTGIPNNLGKLFQQAYAQGARVHSNSWGASVAGEYTVESAATDNFMWKKKDMTITFSAGNSGTDADRNGVVDFDSLGSPATAKNVISVGASENDRQGHYECDLGLSYTSHDLYQSGQTCTSMGGQNLLGQYGQRYPDDFPRNPLKDDFTAGNAEQLAAWSSRGPTDDGRIKPDVVAPGTWVLSAFSSEFQEGYGDPVNPRNNAYQWDGWGMPRNEFYKYMGGTSMSNPLAAGAAVLVRDYYQKAHGHNASAALVKATLINSAHDLLDENNDGANDNDYPIPNNHEGWGRVDVAAATDGTRQFIDDTVGLQTNKKKVYTFNLPGGAPFKVTLVWTDYPGSLAAARNLVNDLDLVVIAPNGTKYKGNRFSGGWSIGGGSADRVNNVENVFISSAMAGEWKVQVKGYNVPNGPQPFALVVQGP